MTHVTTMRHRSISETCVQSINHEGVMQVLHIFPTRSIYSQVARKLICSEEGADSSLHFKGVLTICVKWDQSLASIFH